MNKKVELYRRKVIDCHKRANAIALELFGKAEAAVLDEIVSCLKQGATDEEMTADLKTAIAGAKEAYGDSPTPEQVFLVFTDFFVQEEDDE